MAHFLWRRRFLKDFYLKIEPVTIVTVTKLGPNNWLHCQKTWAAKHRVRFVALTFSQQQLIPQIWSPLVTKSAAPNSLFVCQFYICLYTNISYIEIFPALRYSSTKVSSCKCYCLVIPSVVRKQSELTWLQFDVCSNEESELRQPTSTVERLAGLHESSHSVGAGRSVAERVRGRTGRNTSWTTLTWP